MKRPALRPLLARWQQAFVGGLLGEGRSVLATWAVAVLLLALGWWQVAVHIHANEQREMSAALRDLGNLTRVSQEHADRTLHSADQVIRFVRSRYLELGPLLDLPGLDQTGVIDGEHFPQIGIIDAHGRYIMSSLGKPAGIDLSDREHFRVHLPAGQADSLFVSVPVVGRASGKRAIQLTRRISLPDGSFGGVVVLSLDPDYFVNFYAELQLGPSGVAALTGLDGIARARRAGDRGDGVFDAPGAQVFDRLRAGDQVGSYSARSPSDGVERLMHFRRLAGYPLAVVAGQSIDDILASHRVTRQLLLAQAALLSALVLVLTALLVRHLRRTRVELASRLDALQQVSARNESLAALFSLSPDGFVGFDHADLVKYVNPAFQQLLGTEDGELIGLHAHDFNQWLAARCQPEATYSALLRQPQRIVVGAARRALLVTSQPGQHGGLARLLYFRDITREPAGDAEGSDLLAAAAHELRTPMASIYGFSEVLATHPVSASERAEFIQIIHQQAGLMAQILDDLLELSRQDGASGLALASAALDLNQLASDVIRNHRRPAGRQAPHFDAGAGRLELRGDAGKLRQAFLNVLVNAYKFSPADSVVQVGFAVRRKAGQQQVGLRVVDQGIGMSPDQVRQVCDRFYRVDRTSTQAGTGLGMSIVKAVISAHGGEVDIASTLGRGTAVTLWLPAAPLGTLPEIEPAECLSS